MARSFSRIIRGQRRSVRETAWIAILPITNTLAAASTAVLTGGLNAVALALRPFTIVRVRGFLQVSSDQNAASENYSASVGYCVVSDQAFAIGVTAVPTSETDRGSDLFFVHESAAGRIVRGDTTGFQDPVGIQRVFDSKAMRKVNEDSTMAIVIETSFVSSGVLFHESARMLIKLH